MVGRAHGLRGAIRIFLYNADSNAFAHASRIFLHQNDELHEYKIDAINPSSRGQVLSLVDVQSRSQAEALKGASIHILRDALPPPDPDEFFVTDLIGLEARVGEKTLGSVSSSREQGGIEVITIVGDDEEIQVPLVEEYVEKIDFERSRVELRDIDLLPRNPKRRRD